MPKHKQQGNDNRRVKSISPEKALYILQKSPSREECLKLEERLKHAPSDTSYKCVLKCLDVEIDILALLEHNVDQITTIDQIEKLNEKARLINNKIKEVHIQNNELVDDFKKEVNTFKNKCLSKIDAFKEKFEKKKNKLKEEEMSQVKESQQKMNSDI
ncbi:hypothetical protein [Candidatus Mesenet endosymbiont of Phosphuga atrata]|uniref:hypothetical protein n=1 Tax=Candidatus Mesenet endosymbiont of Phosphuga atrata TaxID=3066221 RepID=UPI0030CD5559